VSQTYPDIPSNQSLSSSRQLILDRDEALRSCFSGTTAPATPVVGQLWFDTSDSEFYLCTATTPSVVWTRIAVGVPVPVTQGGTGATSAASARSNLGLGDLATQNASNLASDVTQSSTGFIKVASGTDAQRPGTPVNGMIRYSTTSQSFEGYINGTWQPIGAGSLNIAVQRFNGTGTVPQNLTLTTAPASANAVDVYIGGVYQQKNTFSVAGVTVSLLSGAPVGTNNIEVVVGTGLAIGVAADASVTPAKLNLAGEFDVAAAATTDIGVASAVAIRITGSGQSITSLGTNFFGPRFVRMAGANTLVHSASLQCPGDGNLELATGAAFTAIPLPSAGGWRISDVLHPSPLGMRRNKIINGKMDIAQRGTSFAAIANNTYSMDRWVIGQDHDGAGTVTQQADVPSSNEFQYSYRYAVTTADASIAAAQYSLIEQKLEGFNARDLIGRTFTISFWVRSSKTGVHCVSLRNNGGDRSYVAEYTISAANTWEYKSISVSGGLITAGTWNWTNGIGLRLQFVLASGTTYHTTANAWQTGNFLATSSQVNCLDTIGNIFAITGVQLELGSVATPFEHRLINEELAACQRYLTVVTMNAQNASAGFSISPFYLPVAMRATPSMTQISAGTGVNATINVVVSQTNLAGYMQINSTAASGAVTNASYFAYSDL